MKTLNSQVLFSLPLQPVLISCIEYLLVSFRRLITAFWGDFLILSFCGLFLLTSFSLFCFVLSHVRKLESPPVSGGFWLFASVEEWDTNKLLGSSGYIGGIC